MEEIWNLRSVHLFRGLSPVQMDEIIKMMPVNSYRKGEFVFLAGEAADKLYVLQVGTVKISYVDLNGDEKVLNIFQAGDIFGDLFLGHYRHRIGQCQALEDVIVCPLREVDFLNVTQRFPQVALNFIRHQADEHRETVARMHALLSMDAKHRLLGTLLSLARRFCCDKADWFTLPESLTQEDIANMTGLNRSTVSLLINDLRRQGILGGTGRSLSVNKRAVEEILEQSGSEILE
jgi:CRP/FNR family transcriptional regulator